MHSLNHPLHDESIEISKAITSWLASQASILHPKIGSFLKLSEIFLMGVSLDEGVAHVLNYKRHLEDKSKGLCFELEIKGKEFKPHFKPNSPPTDEELALAREELKRLKVKDPSFAVSDLYLEKPRKELWFSF